MGPQAPPQVHPGGASRQEASRSPQAHPELAGFVRRKGRGVARIQRLRAAETGDGTQSRTGTAGSNRAAHLWTGVCPVFREATEDGGRQAPTAGPCGRRRARPALSRRRHGTLRLALDAVDPAQAQLLRRSPPLGRRLRDTTPGVAGTDRLPGVPSPHLPTPRPPAPGTVDAP
jgi:hypothetical protein